VTAVPDTGILGERPFQPLVSTELPEETLEQLSGNHFYATKHPDESGLMERVRLAWTKPARELSCAEVRTLTLQKLGLKWLAPSVLELVTKHPTIDCGVYPGDLAVASLLAWRELHAIAPLETKRMVEADFAFLRDDPDIQEPHSIIKDSVDALNEAQAELADT
jgi:hypothetical protein